MIATSFCNRCEGVLCLNGNFLVRFSGKLVGQLTLCEECLSKVLAAIAKEVNAEKQEAHHGSNKLLLQSSQVEGRNKHLCLACWQWTGEVQPNARGELICQNCL